MLTIAIDGPAASGKGTLAKRLAAHYGLACLDTGLLYRAVGRDVLAAGKRLEDETAAAEAAKALDPATLDDERLRLPEMGEAASVVARVPAVRAALLDFQRGFAKRPPGAVLDGRDIATIVLPDADVKIFVVADLAVRARRRHQEMVSRGEPDTYEHTYETLRDRDERDMTRKDAPLQQAEDAVLLDTTHLGIEEALAAAVQIVEFKLGRADAIEGRIASGIGLGKTFTRLDWAREQFMARVGIDPFAGTLNVKVADGPSRATWDRLKATPGIHIDNPNDGPHDCDARCYRVEIVGSDGRSYPAAIVLPEVDGYPGDQIELICATGLREALGLADGDSVRLRFAQRAVP